MKLAKFSRTILIAEAVLIWAAALHAQTALVTVTTSAAASIATNIPVPTSSGTTYVLEKDNLGTLTLSGQLTGGTGSILRTTTNETGDNGTVIMSPVMKPRPTELR